MKKIDSAKNNTASVNTNTEKKAIPETTTKQQQNNNKEEVAASVKTQPAKNKKNSVTDKEKEENKTQAECCQLLLLWVRMIIQLLVTKTDAMPFMIMKLQKLKKQYRITTQPIIQLQ